MVAPSRQQTFAGKGEVAVSAHDDVVDNSNIDVLEDALKLLSEAKIIRGWGDMAARVVMT